MFLTLRLSSLVVAIDKLVHRVSGESILDDFYEQFLLINETGLTLEKLCLVEKARRSID